MVKKILVLDGGGVKGVITLKFLSMLEQKYQINVSQQFDIFAGTSTGALIAALMAYCGLSATEILKEVYTIDNMQKIMTQSYYEWAASSLQMCSRYDDNQKMTFIKQYLKNPQVRLSDIKKTFLAVAYNPSIKAPLLFRNYFNKPDYLLAEALNASSAAPTYFPIALVQVPTQTVNANANAKAFCQTTPDSKENGELKLEQHQHQHHHHHHHHHHQHQLLSEQPNSRDYSCSEINEQRDMERHERPLVNQNINPVGVTQPDNIKDIDTPVGVTPVGVTPVEVKLVGVTPESLQTKEALEPKREDLWAVDGGIYSNNPSDIIYLDCLQLYPNEKFQILSVGTGISRSKFQKVTNRSLGGWDWMIDDHIVDLLLDSNQTASHIRTKALSKIHNDQYLRVNEYLRTATNRLDDTRAINYQALLEEGELWWRLYTESPFWKNFI